MAKKFGKIAVGTHTGAAPVAKTTTPVRNTAIPKTPVAKKEITHEMIAKRAYEIWQSGNSGSELENWLRAERELRAL
ncbi:MAG: DUF2934 domain-containing protein [Bacillota bacterium]